MSTLVLNPITQNKLDTFIVNPPHAILLVGEKGIGKKAVAEYLAENILGIEDFSNYPFGLTIELSVGSGVGIDAVREIEHFMSLKVIGTKITNRIVIILDADLLSLNAQNALLKTIEEPPKGSIIILCVNHEQNLLPTIRSRSQTLSITPPDKESLKDRFKEVDVDTFNQAYAISGGLPGTLDSLINNDDHPLRQATNIARQILSKNTFERLILVDQIYKQKELCRNVLIVLQHMAEISLMNKKTDLVTRKWHTALEASYEALDQLDKNVQTKLVMTNLMLNL